MVRQERDTSRMVRGEGDGVQGLRENQHRQKGAQPGGEPHTQHHDQGTHHQPSGQGEFGQPATLAEEPGHLNHHAHGPQNTDHGFAVAQCIQVKRQKGVNAHVREDMKKQRREKPGHRRLAQDGPNRQLLLVGGHHLFAIGNRPDAGTHGQQHGRVPLRQVAHAKPFEPGPGGKYGH